MVTVSTCLGIGSIINLNEYPIHEPHSAKTLEFMQESHDSFVRDGIFALRGFVFPEMVEKIVSELAPKINQNKMCECNVQHNIYQFDDDDPFFDSLHPRNAKMHSKFFNLPNDEISNESIMRRVYDWDLMTRFISALVYGNVHDPRSLYRFDDPLAALTCNVLFDGNIVDWHFDQAPFTVIILLQHGEVGGLYEVAPETLYSNVGGYEYDYSLHGDIINEVKSTLNVNSYRFNPGDLIVHRGTHSIHRVTTVFGGTPRMTALFEYAPEQNMSLPPSVRQSTYCTSAALEYCLSDEKALV